MQVLKIRKFVTRIDTCTYLQYPGIPTDIFKIPARYLHDTYMIPANTYQKIKGQHYYL